LQDEGTAITLGVIALDQITPLERAVNDFALADQAALAKQDREPFLKIADARSNSESYGKTPENQGPSHYDLVHLAQNVKQDPPNARAAEAANAVIQLTKNAVVYSIHGKARPNAN